VGARVDGQDAGSGARAQWSLLLRGDWKAALELFEQATALQSESKVDIIATPSIINRYVSLNTTKKPFDNPKVREALNYAINKEALAKVAFSGYAVPADGVIPEGVDYATKLGPWPYDPAKARALLKEAGYPNGFETTLWSAYNNSTSQKTIQFVQQQLAQIGIKLQVQALEVGQRTEQVDAWPDPKTAKVRMYYTGWSSSTGEADWGLRPLFASEAWAPKLNNMSFYKSEVVDNALAKALVTTDEKERTALYKTAQEEIRKDLPRVPMITEQNLSAHAKRLSGVFVMPDGNINIDAIAVSN